MLYIDFDSTDNSLRLHFTAGTETITRTLLQAPRADLPTTVAEVRRGWRTFDNAMRARFDRATVLQTYLRGLSLAPAPQYATDYGYDADLYDEVFDLICDALYSAS